MTTVELKEDTIKTVLENISNSFDTELYGKTQEQLEEYWFFEYESVLSVNKNLYKFIKAIELYGRFCEQWEEYHNGSVCVVERVRDKYLMPKIAEFCANLIGKE